MSRIDLPAHFPCQEREQVVPGSRAGRAGPRGRSGGPRPGGGRRGNRRGSCRRPGPGRRPPRGRRRGGRGRRSGERGGAGRGRRPGRRGSAPGTASVVGRGARTALSSRWLRTKPEVVRRVARVRGLEVDEGQPPGVDQDVLGAEVGVDETAAGRPASEAIKRRDRRGEVGVDPGDRPVERVDPELVEDDRVGERPVAPGPGDRASRRGSCRASPRRRGRRPASASPARSRSFQTTASSGAQVIANR